MTLWAIDAGVRVFDDRSQRGVGEGKASLAATVEPVRQQTKRVGVAFEGHEIGPLFGCEQVAHLQPSSFGEISANGFLARVTEWRIAHVVRQTCGGHDRANLLERGLRVRVLQPVHLLECLKKKKEN